MKPNVGGLDRNIRFVLGVVLLIIGVAAPISPTLQIIVLVIAAIAVTTAIVHFCPLNALLGINTCKIDYKK